MVVSFYGLFLQPKRQSMLLQSMEQSNGLPNSTVSNKGSGFMTEMLKKVANNEIDFQRCNVHHYNPDNFLFQY